MFLLGKSLSYFVHLSGAKTPKIVQPAINLFMCYSLHKLVAQVSKYVQLKCAHRVQGAPVMTNTEGSCDSMSSARFTGHDEVGLSGALN